MYFFTADQHYGHKNIIKYTNRPFTTTHEMNKELIKRHNEVVGKDDVVVHAGDFAWVGTFQEANDYFRQLNGTHIYLKGCHDKWMPKNTITMWREMIGKQYVVVCHYPMRSWPRSYHGSFMLYGHCHGRLAPLGKQWDVGVDNNDFYPVSFEKIVEIMNKQENLFM